MAIKNEAPWGTYGPSAMQRMLIHLARNSVLHRGKFRHAMTRLISSLGTPLDVVFRGSRYRIDGKQNLIEYGLLLHPTYNAKEIDFLIEGLSDGGVFVDIGSNIGLYSLPVARHLGQTGKVIGIDANCIMTEKLAFNAKQSGFSNVVPINIAVGETEGYVELAMKKNDLAIVNVVETEGGKIPMQPLTKILSTLGVDRVDVLKIDIEGHEDKALVPFFRDCASELLPRRIVIERAGDGDYPGCLEAFERHGYQLCGRTRNNSLYSRSS